MMIRFGLIAALVAGVGVWAAGCGDDDGGTNTNNNNNVPADDTIYQLQDESHTDFIPTGSTVRLENVVVTAVDNYGQYTGNVFIQEPAGGKYSGTLCYVPVISGGQLSDLSVGTIVNVSGEKDEFALSSDTSGRTMTELVSTTIEIVGQGTPLDPEVVPSAQTIMEEPGAEEYEGVLVEVQNVRRTGTNSYGDVNFTGGLVVGNDLMDAATETTDGSCYSRVVGVLNYFFDYKLHPRSAADFELATDQNACEQVSDEVCDDNIDNDGDGYTDCDDFSCTGDPACVVMENSPALCSDGQDNDGDGDTDCDDWSCRMHPDVLAAGTCSEETGDTQCSDGQDNDGDSYTDCADWSCQLNAAVTVCATAVEDTAAECSDGQDNDGDSYTDCSDYSCQYAGVCADEESTPAECSDGLDNDNDTYADCRDWSCQRSILVTNCEGNVFTCSDGLDNDENGFVDCNDFACRNCNFNWWVPVCPPCP